MITKLCTSQALKHILSTGRNINEMRHIGEKVHIIMASSISTLTNIPIEHQDFANAMDEITFARAHAGAGFPAPKKTNEACVINSRSRLLACAKHPSLDRSGVPIPSALRPGPDEPGIPLNKQQFANIRSQLETRSRGAMTEGIALAHDLAISGSHCTDTETFFGIVDIGHSPNLLKSLEETRSAQDLNAIMANCFRNDTRRYNRLLSIKHKSSGAFLDDNSQDNKHSEYYKHAFLFRYGLPIFNFINKMTCPWCMKKDSLDRQGDHVFHCKTLNGKQRTSLIHNPMRDALCKVMKEIAKLSPNLPINPISICREPNGLVADKAGCTATKRPADVYYSHLPTGLNMIDDAGNRVMVHSTAIDIKTVAVDLDRSPHRERNDSAVKSNEQPHPLDTPHLLKAERLALDGRAYGGGLANFLAGKGIAFTPAAIDTYGAIGPSLTALLENRIASWRVRKPGEPDTAFLHAESACFSFNNERKDICQAPPYTPPAHLGLLISAPKNAKANGTKMKFPWYQGNYLNKQEQFLSTTLSQGVGQCLTEAAMLVNTASMPISSAPFNEMTSSFHRSDTTNRFMNDRTFAMNAHRVLQDRPITPPATTVEGEPHLEDDDNASFHSTMENSDDLDDFSQAYETNDYH